MADSVVETAYGKVRGYLNDGVHNFKGIPYGGPTGGPNRFKRSQPPKAWKGVRDATVPVAGMVLAPQGTEVPEDALIVNVWTTSLDPSQKRPVIVAMPHFSAGPAIGELQNLAATGEAVGVSFSHRGGITGHLFLADIGGDEYAESGNIGQLDDVAALRWIRDNIAAFGGDPSRVMLYGCSGCASEITILSGVPEAKGLFHRALISEGFMQWGMPRFLATKFAERVLAKLEIGHDELHKLQDIPLAQLQGAIERRGDLSYALSAPVPFQSWWQFYPVTDGLVLPTDPYANGSPACSADVPIMLGYAKDTLNMINGTRPWAGTLDDVGLEVLAENHLGPEFVEAALAAERQTTPNASPTRLALSLINHRTFLQGWIRQAEQRVIGAEAPTYVYRFDYETSLQDGLWGAVHGGEFNFFLHNVDAGGYGAQFGDMYADRPDRYELQKLLNESFLRFAHDGTPETAALGRWPGYDVKTRSTMVFDSECRLVKDPDPILRKAYANVPECAGPGDYRRALRLEGFVE